MRRATGKGRMSKPQYAKVAPKKKALAAVVFTQLFGVISLCAHAQNTPTEGEARSKVEKDSTATLNTVEVTAQRRREPIREVPMQVNTLSAEELQREGDQGIRDYMGKQPGVNLNDGGGAGQAQLSMRGVTTGNQVSPTVSVYIDDVPFGSSTLYGSGSLFALDMGLLDLNHLEILRGPQGTLYGAGAMGGLLKYVTNEPDTQEFSGVAGATFSTTKHGGFNHTESAAMNIPLKEDVAALRLSLFNDDNAGYVNAIGPASRKGADGATRRGARASLQITPTSDLTIRLTATGQTIRRDGTSFVDYDVQNRRPLYGDLTQFRKVGEPFKQSLGVYSASVEYNMGWARFASISSYQTMRNDITADVSTIYAPLLNPIFTPVFGRGLDTVAQKINFKTNKFAQEFRLTSSPGKVVDWLAGVFYTDERSEQDVNALTTFVGGGTGPLLLSSSTPSTYKEFAGFGDITFHVTDKLDLTGGMRIARNRQTFSQAASGLLAPSQPPASTSSDVSKTYMLTLRYLLNEQNSIYARAASGYRPGGPLYVVIDPTTGLPSKSSFAPDTLWSYEVGYKADLLDKRLSFSATAFETRWKNIQLVTSVAGLSSVTNGGTARSRGLELSSAFKPTSNWLFGLSASATDAKLTQDVPGIGAVSGDRMPDSPRFSIAASVDYFFPVWGYRAYVGATERYVSSRNSSFVGSRTNPNVEMPGYAVTDLRAGVDLKKATVSFFLKNLFDRRGITSAQGQGAAFGGPAQVTYVLPRTIGMDVRVPF